MPLATASGKLQPYRQSDRQVYRKSANISSLQAGDPTAMSVLFDGQVTWLLRSLCTGGGDMSGQGRDPTTEDQANGVAVPDVDLLVCRPAADRD
jgi:hypothetical protein